MHRLRKHADCIKPQLPAWPKGFVHGFPRDSGILGNQRHAPRAGNIANCCRKQCRVVLFKNRCEICRHFFIAVQALSRIELGEFGSPEFGSPLAE